MARLYYVIKTKTEVNYKPGLSENFDHTQEPTRPLSQGQEHLISQRKVYFETNQARYSQGHKFEEIVVIYCF